MAVFSFVPVMPAGNGTSTNNIYNATLGAAANSANIATGNDMIIRIVCTTGPICVRFGTVANLQNAGATDFLIPPNVATIIDMGHINNAINIYSTTAANAITVTQIVRS